MCEKARPVLTVLQFDTFDGLMHYKVKYTALFIIYNLSEIHQDLTFLIQSIFLAV